MGGKKGGACESWIGLGTEAEMDSQTDGIRTDESAGE